MFGLRDIGNGTLILEDIFGKKPDGNALKEGIIGWQDIGKLILVDSFGLKAAGQLINPF